MSKKNWRRISVDVQKGPRVAQPSQVPANAKLDELVDYFSSRGLPCLSQSLIENGVDDLQLVRYMAMEDIDEIIRNFKLATKLNCRKVLRDLKRQMEEESDEERFETSKQSKKEAKNSKPETPQQVPKSKLSKPDTTRSEVTQNSRQSSGSKDELKSEEKKKSDSSAGLSFFANFNNVQAEPVDKETKSFIPKPNKNKKLNPKIISVATFFDQQKGKLFQQEKKEETKTARQMQDKNTLRKKFRDLFINEIERYRENDLDEKRELGDDVVHCACFLRKRPVFDYEEEGNEFDVVSCSSPESSDFTPYSKKHISKRMILHNCLVQHDLFSPYVQHLNYHFDGVFDETVPNEVVFEAVVLRLLKNTGKGNNSTLFMLGQTGSGKTYTMQAIQDRIAQILQPREKQVILLEYFEIQGSKCLDLLSEEEGQEVEMRVNKKGFFDVIGTAMARVETSEELKAWMVKANERRSTRATAVNKTSSRSHSVCRITCVDMERQTSGRLLLVDLAGTERRKDTTEHDATMTQESAKINDSWFKLKECIRARGRAIQQGKPISSVYMPFRTNPLTKLLSESLADRNTYVSAIGCVSPCATDTDHSISTLRTVFSLSGRSDLGTWEQVSDVLR